MWQGYVKRAISHQVLLRDLVGLEFQAFDLTAVEFGLDRYLNLQAVDRDFEHCVTQSFLLRVLGRYQSYLVQL